MSEPPRRRRRRWHWVVGVVAVLALLAGTAELALRSIIPSVVESQVREQLSLRKDHPVEVRLEGSSLLPALSGRLGRIELTVPDLELAGGISTTIVASADSLPFDPSRGELAGGTASATIPSNSMGAVVALATGGLIDSGEVQQGELVVGRSVRVFGFEVPITAALGLSVEGGELLIQPKKLSAIGLDLTAEQLRSVLGDQASALLDPHAVCVRDRLPRGVELTGIELRSSPLGGSAVVTARLAPDLLSNPEQQQFGSC